MPQDGGRPPSWIWSNRKLHHSTRRHWKPHPRTKHEMDRMTRCGDIADFSLCMRISAIFLLPVEFLVTDSESHTSISCPSLLVNMVLSGLVFEICAWDRQTPARCQTLLKVLHLLLQAGHLKSRCISKKVHIEPQLQPNINSKSYTFILRWPWVTLEPDISYWKLIEDQYFKICCTCHVLNYITLWVKKLCHFFMAYRPNFRNIEQIFTKLGINHVLFMLNIKP